MFYVVTFLLAIGDGKVCCYRNGLMDKNGDARTLILWKSGDSAIIIRREVNIIIIMSNKFGRKARIP